MSTVATSKPHQSRDTAWKDVLDAYFKEFVDLCLHDLYGLIDWEQPWSSLDKEFHAITKDGLIGKRLVDKLFKVYLKTGEEQWVLIHLEIQGELEALFPKRMFIYSYRIYDKYQKQIVSCAILADTNPDWRPSHYEVALAGSRLRLDYRVVKLLDYQGQEESLEISSNPFASVILSHLAAIKVKNSSDKVRLQTKLDLTKRLYRKGYTKEQVLKLYLFIDWLLHLPEALEIEYKEEVYQLEAAQKMAYISTIERFGIKKGIQQGIRQGIQQGEQELLLRLLQRKFNKLPESYCQKLAEADTETLLLWGERILDAKKLEDIFKD
jgi:hypothetical protein